MTHDGYQRKNLILIITTRIIVREVPPKLMWQGVDGRGGRAFLEVVVENQSHTRFPTFTPPPKFPSFAPSKDPLSLYRVCYCVCVWLTSLALVSLPRQSRSIGRSSRS